MARVPRSFYKTSYFHILVQGINKSFIFNTKEDMERYLYFILKYKRDYSINVVAYCIMNNHTHLLLETSSIKELSAFMHRINTSYAVYYNKKHERVGYVFRDRYKSEGIYSEEYLYNCIHYIHNNPVKAKMCDKPEDYKFSSCKDCDIRGIKTDNTYDMSFLEIEEDIEIKCKKIVEEFLKEESLNKEDLKKDNKKLKELVIILKVNNNISYRKISNELEIGREILRKILK